MGYILHVPRTVSAAHKELVLHLSGDLEDETGIASAEIRGRARGRYVSAARRLLYLRLWREGLSIAEVGRATGRDHTTIIFGLKKELGDDAYEREVAVRTGRKDP